MEPKPIKVGIISSPGGHLFQTYQVKKWWNNYPHFWVTDNSSASSSLLQHETVYHGFFPENRNTYNAIRNLLLAIKIIYQEKPRLLFSCGAGIAPPFFLVGKIFGCKLVYLEPYDFIEYPTLTGKLLSRFVDLMLVQHPLQKKFFKNAKYWGKTV